MLQTEIQERLERKWRIEDFQDGIDQLLCLLRNRYSAAELDEICFAGLVEELGETIQAICKYWRSLRGLTPVHPPEAWQALLAEMADAFVYFAVLRQMGTVSEADLQKIESDMSAKLARWKKRINEHEQEGET